MGAQVTRRRPADADPARRSRRSAATCATTLDDLREADVVYALRMQHERMDEAFVPSLREYAAVYQIDGRRLRPAPAADAPRARQPRRRAVRRGRRLAAGADPRPGRGRRRRAHGGALRAARRARARAPSRRRSPSRRTTASSHEPRDPLVRAPRAAGRPAGARRARRSTRARASTRAHDVLVRDGEIAELGAPGALEAPAGARWSRRGAATCSRPSSTRTSTCARPGRSTRRTSRPARAPPPPAASARRRDAEHRPRGRLGADPRARCATPPRARRASRSASWPAITRGLAGERADRDGRAARRRARSASPTTAGRCVSAGHAAQGAAVPAPLRRRARAARGGPVAVAATASMHEGAVSARSASRGIPSDQRVDDGRARRRDRRLRGRRASTCSTSAARASVEAVALAKARGCAGHRRGLAAPPDASPTRPSAALDTTHEDEPAAAHRGRPPGADRGAARRHRSTASRPTTRRTRATRRRSRSSRRRWARPASRPRSPRCYTDLVLPGVLALGLLVERMTAGAALLDLPTPRIAAGEPGEPLPRRPRRRAGSSARTATRAARRTAASPARELRGRVLLTVAAGAVAYRERAFAVSAAPVLGSARRERRGPRPPAGRARRRRRAGGLPRRGAGRSSASPRGPRCWCRARAILGLPVLVTEQYPRGLGDTVPELLEHLEGVPRLPKTVFSAARADGFDLDGPRPGARVRDRGARVRQPDGHDLLGARRRGARRGRRGRLAHGSRPRGRAAAHGARGRRAARASRWRCSSSSARRERRSSRRSRG